MTDTMQKLEERVKRLEQRLRSQRRLGGVAILLVVLLAGASFPTQTQRPKFTEISVERLNVVEPDGQLVLTLANTARLPDPLIAGKTVTTNRTGPGIIFFDGKGWEVGGLVYQTQQTRDGYRASGHLSFDQFHNDQVVFLSYQDNGNTNKSAGLHVVDRARSPTIDELLKLRDSLATATAEERAATEARLRGTAAPRVFVGSENETAMLRLRDRAGRDRLRLLVDPQGVAKLEFLDEQGKVVERLPK